jgi:hypothetical protein
VGSLARTHDTRVARSVAHEGDALCLELARRLDVEAHDFSKEPLQLLWRTVDAAINFDDFDLDRRALDVGVTLHDPSAIAQPVAPAPPRVDEFRTTWRRFRQWTIMYGFFSSDDPTTPDSFYSRSSYGARDLRFAIATDASLRTRLIVDRLDGRGPIEGALLSWLIECFIGATVDTDLIAIDKVLSAESA